MLLRSEIPLTLLFLTFCPPTVHPETNQLTKCGQYLKPSDRIRLDDGRTWTVDKFRYESSLSAGDLKRGKTYDVLSPHDSAGAFRQYKLIFADKMFDRYVFSAIECGDVDLSVSAAGMPAVFPVNQGRRTPKSIELINDKSADTMVLDYDKVMETKYKLDTDESHILFACG